VTSERKPERTNRKEFLNRLLTGWILLTGLPVLYAITSYIIPPRRKEKPVKSLAIGSLESIPKNGSRVVRLNRKPIIVIRSSGDELKAFSGMCTHLGCLVEFKPDPGEFRCNCHGSVFDAAGKNISGPAPRPLARYAVTVENAEVTITTTESSVE
jgi:cytochrome b6-f complex iron-sulfur subunit